MEQLGPPEVTRVEADGYYKSSREVRRPTPDLAKARPTLRDVLDAKRCNGSNGHHRDRQPDAKAKHKGGAQRELFELEANQQNSDRSGAGDKPAGKSEHYDLARSHMLVGEAPSNILGMCTFVRIRELLGVDMEACRLCMFVFAELQVEAGDVAPWRGPTAP